MNTESLKDSMIELERFYIMTLAVATEGAGYDAVLQQMEQNVGRLWLIPQRKGAHATTVPDAFLSFKFQPDDVILAVKFRDEGHSAVQGRITYIEGLDGFLEQFVKSLQANRLTYKQSPKEQGAVFRAAHKNGSFLDGNKVTP